MIRTPAPLRGALSVACATMSSAVWAGDGTMTEASGQVWSWARVLVLATFIGLGVIGRVSRLLHTPLMSLTNAISAISVVGSILIAGSDYPPIIRALGAVAL